MSAVDYILGQPRAVQQLQAALAAGRLHHAYVFHGPAGVGKFTTALALARLVLCHDVRPDLSGQHVACEACRSCRLLGERGAGAHPDLHVVTKELALFSEKADDRKRKLTNIPVAVVRKELIGPAYLAARLDHGKVFIVDEAELLDPPSQNAMLKTLEEPPVGSHLILVTAREERLLPTVRSRCQRVAFGSLPAAVVARWLHGQDLTLDGPDLEGVVELADGSLGQAQLVVQYGLLAWSKQVLPAIDAMVEGTCAVELGSNMMALVDGYAKAWVEEHKAQHASKDAANRRGAGLMWALIAGHARRRLAQAANGCAAGELLEAEAALDPWLGVIDAVRTAERELAANLNLGLVMDHLAATMYGSLAGAAARA